MSGVSEFCGVRLKAGAMRARFHIVGVTCRMTPDLAFCRQRMLTNNDLLETAARERFMTVHCQREKGGMHPVASSFMPISIHRLLKFCFFFDSSTFCWLLSFTNSLKRTMDCQTRSQMHGQGE